MKSAGEPIGRILLRSGIYYRIAGTTPKELIADGLLRLPLPAEIDSGRVLAAIMEREQSASSAIGDGLAMPHCRHESLSLLRHPLVSLNFPAIPLSGWGYDTVPVFAFFIILCPDSSSHLRVIKDLSVLLRLPEFNKKLVSQSNSMEIMTFISQHDETSAMKPR